MSFTTRLLNTRASCSADPGSTVSDSFQLRQDTLLIIVAECLRTILILRRHRIDAIRFESGCKLLLANTPCRAVFCKRQHQHDDLVEFWMRHARRNPGLRKFNARAAGEMPSPY